MSNSAKQIVAALLEYGGHYCPKCQKPSESKWEAGKLCCVKCGGPLQYPKSASLRSKESKKMPPALEGMAGMSSVDSGMGGELPLTRRVRRHHADEFPRETNRAQDPEAMIARDPLWREKTAQYPDTLSLMRAYLADPSANPEIKRWVNLMLPKE